MTDETYTLKQQDTFVYLSFSGKVDIDNVAAAVTQGVGLAKQTGLNRMLCSLKDIVKVSDISVALQVRGMDILWHMRELERVAFLFAATPDEELYRLLGTSVKALGTPDKGKLFTDEQAAIAWLRQP